MPVRVKVQPYRQSPEGESVPDGLPFFATAEGIAVDKITTAMRPYSMLINAKHITALGKGPVQVLDEKRRVRFVIELESFSL